MPPVLSALASPPRPAAAAPARWPGPVALIRAIRDNAVGFWPDACFREHDLRHTVLGRRIVVVTSPELARWALAGRPAHTVVSTLQRRLLGPALGDGLVLAEGDRWRRERATATRLLAGADQRAVVRDVARAAAALAARGSEDAETDLAQLTLDQLVRALFGRGVPGDSRRAVADAERCIALLERVDLAHFLPPLAAAMLRPARSARRVAEAYDAAILGALDERAIPGLVGDALPARERRDFVVNLLSGYKTTSLGILWTLAALSRSPADHARVAEEALAWQRAGAGIDALGAATWTDLCLREALRLYPPLPFLVRDVPAEGADTPVGPLAGGTILFVAPWIIHRHHAHWPDPERFAPGRFAEPAVGQLHIPFGLGERRCPGTGIGLLTIKAALLSLVAAGGRIEDADGAMPAPRGLFALRPAGRVRLVAP